MIFYRRDIYKKLIALRSFSLIIGILCVLSFDTNKTNLGYFLSVLLLLLAIVVVEDLVVFNDSFKIKKNYFFGLIPMRWNFSKDEKILLCSYGSDFGQEGEPIEATQMESTAGCLFYIFFLFGKQGKITHRRFTIKKNKEKFSFFNSVDIFLNRQEYEFIKEIAAGTD